ncbi:cytochrome c1 [soil metagenome]
MRAMHRSSSLSKLLAVAALAVSFIGMGAPAFANEGGPQLDTFPVDKTRDMVSLQNGAKLFVNYCLNCHNASFVRYNKLQELGLTEAQVKENLMFATDKPGDLMIVALKAANAKAYFGATPPDLSLVAQARSSESGTGADWLYTYLRSFYRDTERPTGWNNVLYPNVGMPHVLWELDSGRDLKKIETKLVEPKEAGEPAGGHHEEHFVAETSVWDRYGIKTTSEAPVAGPAHESTEIEWVDSRPEQSRKYNEQVSDLVAYMVWMSDPSAGLRLRLGVIVIIFLFAFTLFAWGLNRSFWKQVK